MRFWFNRAGKISIREQLVTQVVLGILSGDLPAGQRLPSTRDLARRFDLHPNTVSAAYRELEQAGWLELRHGSGVYVRKNKPAPPPTKDMAIDRLIADIFRSARELGVPLAAIRERLRRWESMQPPGHFLLVEPDEELRRIVIEEIGKSLKLPVKGVGLEVLSKPEDLAAAAILVLPSKYEAVRRGLPEGTECIGLQVRSIPESLAAWLPADNNNLVAVVSRWPGFLESARTMLIAAGFEADALVIRDARKQGWQQALKSAAGVVCDSFMAARIPKGLRVIRFPLLTESCIAELSQYEDFVAAPVDSY